MPKKGDIPEKKEKIEGSLCPENRIWACFLGQKDSFLNFFWVMTLKDLVSFLERDLKLEYLDRKRKDKEGICKLDKLNPKCT